MPSEEPVVKSFKLRGHLGPVLCLDHSSSRSSQEQPSDTAATLLSGSEDGTCRIWDLRASCRASLCIKCPGDVLSVAFGPTFQEETQDQLPSPFARAYSVYAAVGNSVYGYDLRNLKSPIIEEPSVDFSFLDAPDEVNQIAFSRTPLQARRGGGGGPLPIHLAAADDSGAVRLTACFESSSIDRRKRVFYHGSDESPAMVTCLAFRPRGKQQTLASGGTDCRICLWDSTKKQSSSSVSIPPTDATANQVCNPPMVHALNWSPSGILLAAGLGDGSVALLQAAQSSLVLTARLDEAHGGAVACCLFPEWGSGSNAITAQDRLLCTAGNDSCIVLWDLGSTLCGKKAVNPADVLHLQSSTAVEQQKLELTDDLDIDQPKTLFAMQHTAKPNWIVSSRGRDPVFPSSVFIADTSNDITAYTIPLQ